VQLIAEGRHEEAYLVARSPNPFASICGRICAAPCEDSCRRGRLDAPVSIRALKRFVCEKYGAESLSPDLQDKLFNGGTEPGNKTRWHLPVLTTSHCSVARGQKVAVIGGGPSGLACAHDLALMGYRATVFEASDEAGGMLVHGIPEFRLSRAVIEKEIEKIESLGVEIKLNAPLSESFGLKDLREQGYEAVFLSVGTQRGRDLKIEGAEMDGVVKAVDYLINVNQGYRVNLGRRVLVIGGGFVAFDAARVALRTALEAEAAEAERETEDGTLVEALDVARAARRAGATEVMMISLESFDEMPVRRSSQGREEFEEAEKEGIVFRTQRSARRFVGEGGRVTGVELIGVKRTYDHDGRFNPVFDPSFSEVLEADSVILAIGQQADLSFLKPEDGVELTPQQTIKVDRATLATTAPGVFAGGDVAFGPRNAIEAIANGKTAALSIDDYLRGVKSEPVIHVTLERLPIRSYRMPDEYEKRERQSPPTVALDRRTGISEVETGYDEEEARRQAERCLHCHVQTIYDPEMCVLCGLCVDICPAFCLKLVPADALDLEAGAESELFEFYGIDGESQSRLSAMIKDEDVCIRCGLCALRCPTGAMTMEVFSYEEHESTVRRSNNNGAGKGAAER
jgi:NADPH-dependent glutamate synthase beta subunit-like oxidoreductase